MKFAEIKMITIVKLLEVEIGNMFVSEEAMEEIKKVLELTGKTPDELTAIRNTIVKIFFEEFIDPILEAHESYEEYKKYDTKMSGIVAVIDGELMKARALY